MNKKDLASFLSKKTESQGKASNDGDKVTFRGPALIADTPNKNGRIYPKRLLEEVVAKAQEIIAHRGLIGQIDYPGDSIIHFDQASHVVTDLHMNGNEMVATIEVIDTPCGKILKKLIDEGVAIALRPYGVGSISDDGVVGDSYKMISISVVDAEKAS